MSDVNAYEYGLLQEQDNPTKKVKPTELPIEKTNETKLDELIGYLSLCLHCEESTGDCPFHDSCDYRKRGTVGGCRERLTKFFETGE